ncbi:UDP-N-acetylmuramoyl-tripeptide--D-alanyl-D-alanine ligase [Plasticicumulans acidivorans]|uniref:UDP-N-acetylmuramoyl-tripeptide--D-alanyl-D-alanine ligase n=1 Tax=Plasticicumulans acidivorans TaxID=886464 RepID=A0A317MW12_9GAMM|nr:UDP-N-acetylmuramoyl-tripeptide--D-alanyl-D-alanine ligase [Plasticicumulans acidivorans]PWV61825.1 UDP-N-acetylmuramoyl-tripeptide--D-alanyl-D-alanine ligase [Plasticicumulans acidivorans]
MKPLPLSHLATALCAELIGHDVEVRGVATDSRTVAAGELFVALSGPNFDGHAFAATARERGASAALVAHPLALDLPQLVVADTRLALGRLGAFNRAAFRRPLIGLTGSNGKTTLKELCAAVLRQRGTVLATRGNLNNDIGVPLTLLGLETQDYAVIEMGANHPGEIAYLTGLAMPDVAILNNAGPCHLEGFGDLDGVARAKGEIFSGLGAHGVAVINADDVYVDYWRGLNGEHHVATFALDAAADVTASLLASDEAGQRLRLSTPQGAIECRLGLHGRHNLRNAAAAAAATLAVGATLDDIAAGFAAMQPVAGRLQRLAGRHDSVLINDAYNANPASLAAGLEALGAEPGEHWLVLGDMGELGTQATTLHALSGERARTCGFTRLYGFGPNSRHAVDAFGAGGRHFTDIDTLVSALDGDLAVAAAPIVLVKGSRSMRMERVVRALAIQDNDPNTGTH